MTFEQAKALAETHRNLVGLQPTGQPRISHVLPVPMDLHPIDFLKMYKRTNDIEEAATLFRNQEFNVFVFYERTMSTEAYGELDEVLKDIQPKL